MTSLKILYLILFLVPSNRGSVTLLISHTTHFLFGLCHNSCCFVLYQEMDGKLSYLQMLIGLLHFSHCLCLLCSSHWLCLMTLGWLSYLFFQIRSFLHYTVPFYGDFHLVLAPALHYLCFSFSEQSLVLVADIQCSLHICFSYRITLWSFCTSPLSYLLWTCHSLGVFATLFKVWYVSQIIWWSPTAC